MSTYEEMTRDELLTLKDALQRNTTNIARSTFLSIWLAASPRKTSWI